MKSIAAAQLRTNTRKCSVQSWKNYNIAFSHLTATIAAEVFFISIIIKAPASSGASLFLEILSDVPQPLLSSHQP